MTKVSTKNANLKVISVKITRDLDQVLNIIAKDLNVSKNQFIEYVLGNAAREILISAAKAQGKDDVAEKLANEAKGVVTSDDTTTKE